MVDKKIIAALKPILLWVILGLFGNVLHAQDIHYSQFYADPLRLNPARTGQFNGDYRFGLNVRDQWESVPVPYQTASAYADFGLMRRQYKGGWLGAGLNVLHDRGGTAWLALTEVRALMAVHKALTSNLVVSVGASGAYRYRSIASGLLFGSQWNEQTFDPSIVSGEVLAAGGFGYWDVHTGMSITYLQPDFFSLYFDGSIMHINRPNESFLGDVNRIGQRPVIHIGGSVWLGNLSLEPAAYYTTQKKASELVLGTNIAFALKDGYRSAASKLYLGAWVRFNDGLNQNDAFIIKTGLEMNAYRFLLSYDINTSSLRPATKMRGGLELSLVHVGVLPGSNKPQTIHCPRF